MGAKAYGVLIAIVAASGCADGLKRFAPPGIVKYEDLAKGQPASPAIAARIDANAEAGDGGFPALAAQPTAVPQGIARPERDAMKEALLSDRDALNAAAVEDRVMALEERDASIEEMRDKLGEAVAKDDAAARRERGLPPRAAEQEPEQ